MQIIQQYIRCNISEDDSILNFVEIDCEFVKSLNGAESLRYIGNTFCTSSNALHIIEFQNRKRAAWATFVQYKTIPFGS